MRNPYVPESIVHLPEKSNGFSSSAPVLSSGGLSRARPEAPPEGRRKDGSGPDLGHNPWSHTGLRIAERSPTDALLRGAKGRNRPAGACGASPILSPPFQGGEAPPEIVEVGRTDSAECLWGKRGIEDNAPVPIFSSSGLCVGEFIAPSRHPRGRGRDVRSRNRSPCGSVRGYGTLVPSVSLSESGS